MSFFEALPKLYRTMERDFQTAYPGVRVPNILKIGGWIGGDRDGNPFVSAETLRFAFRRHATQCSVSIAANSTNFTANCHSPSAASKSTTT